MRPSIILSGLVLLTATSTVSALPAPHIKDFFHDYFNKDKIKKLFGTRPDATKTWENWCWWNQPQPVSCGYKKQVCATQFKPAVEDKDLPRHWALMAGFCSPFGAMSNDIESAIGALSMKNVPLIHRATHTVLPLWHMMQKLDEFAFHDAVMELGNTPNCTHHYMDAFLHIDIHEHNDIISTATGVPETCRNAIEPPAAILAEAFAGLSLRDRLNLEAQLPHIRRSLHSVVSIYYKAAHHLAGGSGWQCIKDHFSSFIKPYYVADFVDGEDGTELNLNQPPPNEHLKQAMTNDETGIPGPDPYDMFTNCMKFEKKIKGYDYKDYQS
ncbi:MAG: hypothetical protein M1828_003658 [Chrysothrix sp. TS-e1954]|nr:MAG: hypothetical protein M1828_003658 [Chrysothrix sp. TS-e1954]